jgi:anhydro-N-acetylmuramic acid kinase
MVVAGVMSGTSADGVDVAVCRVSMGKDGVPRVKVLGHRGFRYAKAVRQAVLACAGGANVSAAEMAELSWRLGEAYAEYVAKTLKSVGVRAELVALHGQTVVHQAAGRERFTWQTGEAALIAERLRLPVVSDFRPSDMAAGGQGAPLVPMLDWCVFRHATKSRVLLNLGGIANVTVLPAGCDVDGVIAFDTGPANMAVDALMQRLYGRGYDRNGAVAATGRSLRGVMETLMQSRYFSALPPKSCGREEFGAAFAERLIMMCGEVPAEDVVATATAFTVESVLDAYRRFCWPRLGQRSPGAKATEVLVAGGGAKNRTLMRGLREGFGELGVKLATTESAGFAVEAKEAAAFALLGWLTWHGLPGNVPSATGAGRSVVLGKVTFA